MTTSAEFQGGPVDGRAFNGLRRVPTFVRVVEGPMRVFDVLNDLDDEPADNEDVVGVYLLTRPTPVHVCARGSGGPSGWWVTYVHLPIAEPGILRTDEEWTKRLAGIVGVPVEVIYEQRAAERTAAELIPR